MAAVKGIADDDRMSVVEHDTRALEGSILSDCDKLNSIRMIISIRASLQIEEAGKVEYFQLYAGDITKISSEHGLIHPRVRGAVPDLTGVPGVTLLETDPAGDGVAGGRGSISAGRSQQRDQFATHGDLVDVDVGAPTARRGTAGAP